MQDKKSTKLSKTKLRNIKYPWHEGKDWCVPSTSTPLGTKGTDPVAMMIFFAVTMLSEEPIFTFWGPCTDSCMATNENVKIFFCHFEIASANKQIVPFTKSVVETL